MGDVFRSPETATLVVLIFAFAQIFVHMIYFLHMNTSSEGGWNMLALLFTAVLAVFTLAGSLLVMYPMNANMMPALSAPHVSTMPYADAESEQPRSRATRRVPHKLAPASLARFAPPGT